MHQKHNKPGRPRQTFTFKQLSARTCRIEGAWGLILRLEESAPAEEIRLAAPYLDQEQAALLLRDGWLFILCRPRDLALEYYYHTAGADGSAEAPHNTYSGPCRIVAELINSSGDHHAGGQSHG